MSVGKNGLQFWQRKVPNACIYLPFGAVYSKKVPWHGPCQAGRVGELDLPANPKTTNSNPIQNIMSVNVTPIADRVVVEPAAAEEMTAGGLYIPDTAKEKPQRGKVVAVGAGKKDEPMTVKVGDHVLYGKYAGTEVQIDGQDLLIMRESDLFAIVG